MTTYGDADIKRLVGVTMKSVVNEGDEQLVFTTDDERRFVFYYERDCCASCHIEDVCGDLSDLEGSPIVEAEEVSNYDHPAPEHADSYTWSFYKFRTHKGAVTVRWLGESNGYYSESVSLIEEAAS